MSPGDRSYDAIRLLKQISEQNDATYSNAQEILRNELPKPLPKDAYKDRDKENNVPPNQPRNHSQLASNALVRHNTTSIILGSDFVFCLSYVIMQ